MPRNQGLNFRQIHVCFITYKDTNQNCISYELLINDFLIIPLFTHAQGEIFALQLATEN